MCWYSASAWKHHTQRHIQDNLPIHPDDPTFYQQFSEAETLPSTSKLASAIPQTINIQERAKAAKQFIRDDDFPSQELYVPSSCDIPKHHTKQGPTKSSKKFKQTDLHPKVTRSRK